MRKATPIILLSVLCVYAVPNGVFARGFGGRRGGGARMGGFRGGGARYGGYRGSMRRPGGYARGARRAERHYRGVAHRPALRGGGVAARQRGPARGRGSLATDAGYGRLQAIHSGIPGSHRRSLRRWSPHLTSMRGRAVRRSFRAYDAFTPAWRTAHPGAWLAAGWAARGAWSGWSWDQMAGWYGYSDPIDYDYGTGVVYDDDQVYVDGQCVGSADEYYDQASQLADPGQGADDDASEWKPIGVFGMIQGDQKQANVLFQLAANKDGVIRGNYFDTLSNQTQTVSGAIDKKTQRAAWRVGDKKDTVYEAGMYNLAQDEAPLLVHHDKDNTENWLLVRMQQNQSSN